jgi:serine/threonine-protein kinase/endoribonuclease IRE1
MRNKRHHFQELPEQLKRTLGDTPAQFYRYFAVRFPALLMEVYRAVEGSGEWRRDNPFRDVYFAPVDHDSID